MNRIVNARFLLRFAAAFVILSMGFYFLPNSWVRGIVPLVTAPIHWVFPEYEFDTGLGEEGTTIFMKVKAQKKLVNEPGKAAVIKFGTQIDVGLIYSIPLIFFPLLFAWPGLTPRYRLKGALILFPVIIVLAMIDASSTLIYLMEKKFHDDTLGYQVRYHFSRVMSRGGRQFFGLLLFGVAVAPFYLKKPVSGAGPAPGRNAPCPCGSGKKYKNCCIY
jgi:hypothetical protein